MPLRVARREIVISLAALAIASAAEAQTWPILSPPRTLEEMARRVEREFPNVCHLSPTERIHPPGAALRGVA